MNKEKQQQFGITLLLHLGELPQTRLRALHSDEDCAALAPQLKRELDKLSLRELHRLADRWQRFCRLQLCTDKALDCVAEVRAESDCAETVAALLDLGAPFALLAATCQMSWREYRRRSGKNGSGRPVKPNAHQVAIIERAVRDIAHCHPRDRGDWGIKDWLVLGRMTAPISLKMSWGYLSGADCADTGRHPSLKKSQKQSHRELSP